MARESKTPQIGFFGLSGARIILGLVVLLIVDGFLFNLQLTVFLLDSVTENMSGEDTSSNIIYATTFLTLIFAFVIAGANLLGIIIGEVIDAVIVNYWNRINYWRLITFQKNILQFYPKDEEGTMQSKYDENVGVYIPHLHLNGNVWDDVLFLSYKRDISTRLILILSLFLMGFFLVLIQWDDTMLPDLGITVDLNKVLIAIITTILLLLISLRIKTESTFFSLQTIGKILYKDMLPLIAWIAAIFSDNRGVEIVVICGISVYMLLINSGILEITKVETTRKWLKYLPVLKSDLKIKWMRQNKLSNARLFGKQTPDQWYNLIVCYYELFFNSVNTRRLSKIESYLSVIMGVYISQSMGHIFERSDAKNEDNEETKSDGASVSPITPVDSHFIQQLEKTTKLILEKLEIDNFESAMQLYQTLNEKILLYFTLGSYYREMKKSKGKESDNLSYRLTVEAVPSYIIESTDVAYFIGKMKSPNALERLLGERFKEKISGDVLLAIANNVNCTSDILEKILGERFKEEISGAVLLAIANNANCTSDVLEKILGERFKEEISGFVLLAIANNENCTSDVLEKILGERFKEEINSVVLEAIANNVNCTSDVLEKILGERFKEEIRVGVLLAIANNENCTSVILNNILEVKPEEKISSDTLFAIANNENCTSDILNDILKVKPEEKISSDVLSAVVEHPMITEHTLIYGVIPHRNCTSLVISDILNSDPDKIFNPDQIINSNVLEEIASSRHFLVSDIINIAYGAFGTKITQRVIDSIKENPLIGDGADRDIDDDYHAYMSVLEDVLDKNKKEGEFLANKNKKEDEFLAIAKYKKSTPDMLTKVVEDTKSSTVFLAVVNHDVCTLDILETILEDKKNISSKVLEAIIKNEMCTPKILLAVVNHDKCTLEILETIFFEIKPEEKINSTVLRAIVKRDMCSFRLLFEIVKHPMITEHILIHGVIPHKNCDYYVISNILDSEPDKISNPDQIINSSVLEGIASSRHFLVQDIRLIANGAFRTKITQKVIDNIEKNPSIVEDAGRYEDYPISIELLKQALDENKKRNKL